MFFILAAECRMIGIAGRAEKDFSIHPRNILCIPKKMHQPYMR